MKNLKPVINNVHYQKTDIVRLPIPIFLYIIFSTCIFYNACTNSNTPRKKLIGHWKEISIQHKTDSPDFESEKSDFTPEELYFSANSFWIIEEGSNPVKALYEVTEENKEDLSLIICVTNAKKEKIYSDVYFSPDFKEMKVIRKHDPSVGQPAEIARILREQVGMITIETLYIRVDDKTSPW